MKDTLIFDSITDNGIFLKSIQCGEEQLFLWEEVEFVVLNHDFIFIRSQEQPEYERDFNIIDHRNVYILRNLLSIFQEKCTTQISIAFGDLNITPPLP
jgi:hypothetical protein